MLCANTHSGIFLIFKVNRDTKSKGVIVGFSLNKGVMQCWLLTSHERAAITQACREMAGNLTVIDDGAIKEIGKSRMAVDESDLQKVQAALTNWGILSLLLKLMRFATLHLARQRRRTWKMIF